MATRPATPTSARPPPGCRNERRACPSTVDVLIVGSGPAGTRAGRAAVDLPRHQHAPRRAPRRSAAGRPGRRRRLPHGGDVRGVRPEPEAGARGLLGQRDRVLAPVAAGPLAHRAHRARAGRRGRPVGVAARHRQPGAAAGVPAGLHARSRRRGSNPTTAWSSSTWRSSADGDVPGHGHAARRGERRADGSIRAKYVVGCDGARSRVRAADRRASCAATSPTRPGA